MVSGVQFLETILFWIGIAMLFSAFVSACMESRHSGEKDHVRSWLASRLEIIGLVPFSMILVVTLRMIRDAIDYIVSETITNFDMSSLSASIVMAVLSVMLPIAAGINALLGGSPLFVTLYMGAGVACLILGGGQIARGSWFGAGMISLSVTFMWLVFGPFYAFASLTDHLLMGTFSHSVLGSVLVSVVLYAGCAGAWLFYRGVKNIQTLSSFDLAIARFLFAVPVFYILYWMGLLAGHFAISEVSPQRGWGELSVVVVIGAISFVAILSTIEFGVSEKHQGHGLAVLLAAGIVSLVGVIAINGFVSQIVPFWLTLWLHDFDANEILLGSEFWSSHTPFFLWSAMISFVVFIGIVRIVVIAWPGGIIRIKERPFLGVSVMNTIGAAIVFVGMSLLTFT